MEKNYSLESLKKKPKRFNSQMVQPKIIKELSDLSSDDKKAILESQCLAFDCEGVDLSRHGEICIVVLSTLIQPYLFDVNGLDENADIIPFLKEVLENASIEKIIHDVKMDSDALYHLLGITVAGIHDTQAWDNDNINSNNRNLNATLMGYGCPTNEVRDNEAYNINSRFWATRPLTSNMITWACEDVAHLFLLKEKQIETASALGRITVDAKLESENRARISRSKQVLGKFLGYDWDMS